MDFEAFQKDFGNDTEKHSKYIEWLALVREKNDEYFEVVKKIMPLFLQYSKKCHHKKTILTLLSFHTHLSTLKNAIIDLSDEDNMYSAKALYRIFLEHWLKGTYILARYIREKNDDVGIEYNSLGRIGEELKYGNSIKQVAAMLDAESKNLDVWESLCKCDPNLNKFNKKNIMDNIKEFEYKSIAKYLIDNKVPGADWVSMIISEYSELSSFVHGGPSASEQYASLYNKRFKEYQGMVRFSFNTCRVFAYSVFTLMLKEIDSDKKEQVFSLLLKLRDKNELI